MRLSTRLTWYCEHALHKHVNYLCATSSWSDAGWLDHSNTRILICGHYATSAPRLMNEIFTRHVQIWMNHLDIHRLQRSLPRYSFAFNFVDNIPHKFWKLNKYPNYRNDVSYFWSKLIMLIYWEQLRGVIFKVRTICAPCLRKSLTGGFWRSRAVVRASAMSPVFAKPFSELVAVSQNRVNH
jgi:hypothetical protein